MPNELARENSPESYLLVPLVGAYFRPPAKLVLESMSVRTPLTLVPEPENPYDELAIGVWVRPQAMNIIAAQDREALFAQSGFPLADLIAQEGLIQLGYLARTGPKAPIGNTHVHAAADLVGGWDHLSAELAFGTAGVPLVRISERAGNLRPEEK